MRDLYLYGSPFWDDPMGTLGDEVDAHARSEDDGWYYSDDTDSGLGRPDGDDGDRERWF